jgi:YesN/AraC family two-component response regulator
VVDLLLTDVIMPGMMGPELVARIRVSRPDMKVIFMSGYSHKVLEHETLKWEAGSEFIEKPFTADELQRKLRDMLDPRRYA